MLTGILTYLYDRWYFMILIEGKDLNFHYVEWHSHGLGGLTYTYKQPY